MSKKYDSKTTTFSPEGLSTFYQGRLMQLEYAIEAINKTGSSIGIVTSEGIIMTTQKEDVSSLLEKNKFSEKIYKLDAHLYCIVSGMTADANYLIETARKACQRYKRTYQSPMPIEQLVVRICDIKQGYTQWGGLRPFGTAFLFVGFDKHHNYQLYSTDPSGNYLGWKANAIGNNNVSANTLMREEYASDLTLSQGVDLAIKAIVKTMDTTQPDANKIELMHLIKNSDQGVNIKNYSEDEIKALIEKNIN